MRDNSIDRNSQEESVRYFPNQKLCKNISLKLTNSWWAANCLDDPVWVILCWYFPTSAFFCFPLSAKQCPISFKYIKILIFKKESAEKRKCILQDTEWSPCQLEHNYPDTNSDGKQPLLQWQLQSPASPTICQKQSIDLQCWNISVQTRKTHIVKPKWVINRRHNMIRRKIWIIL